MLSKDDAKSLSKQLTSNDHRLNEEEARAYLKYIKAESDLKHVADKVEENTKDIKNNHYNNLSVDANDNNILNISKDGKNMFLITINLMFLKNNYARFK